MFDAGLVVEEPERGLVLVRLNRPGSMNALTTASAREFVSLYCALAVRSDMRALVITGTGGRAFCSGADLKERSRMNRTEIREQHATHRLALTIRRTFEFPVIAAVNGLALGGGAELALSSDLVFAVPHSEFSLPEIQRGIMPGMGGTQFLTAALGPRRAMEYLLSGEALDAEAALNAGVINRIVAPENLLERALSFASKIGSMPPLAVRAVVRAVHAESHGGLESGLAHELALHQRLMASDDRLEGARAFAEKRAPRWTGE